MKHKAQRKALLVGINAYPQSPLFGCVNDVVKMAEHLQRNEGFAPGDIRIVCDDRATKAEISRGLTWLTQGSAPGDVLLFHFSGHGVQMPSIDPAEPDGLDECICPVEFDWSEGRLIRDKELAALFATVPEGVALTWISDSCHSGDLQRELSRIPNVLSRRLVPPPDIAWDIQARRASGMRPKRQTFRGLLLAACRSDQTAADAAMGPRGQRHGAFTYTLLSAVERSPERPIGLVLGDCVSQLAQTGFTQRPEAAGAPALLKLGFLDAPNGSIKDVAPELPFFEVGVEFPETQRDVSEALVGSGYVANGPGARIRYDVEPTDPDKIVLVLRQVPQLRWWKSLDVFSDVNGTWMGGGRRIEVKDDQREASLDIYAWDSSATLRVELWKAGFGGFGAFVHARHIDRQSHLGRRITFTWEQD